MKEKQQGKSPKLVKVRHVDRPLSEQVAELKKEERRERIRRGRVVQIDLSGVENIEEGLRLRFAGHERIRREPRGGRRISLLPAMRSLLYKPTGRRDPTVKRDRRDFEKIQQLLLKNGRGPLVSWHWGYGRNLRFAWAREIWTIALKERRRWVRAAREGKISNEQLGFLWDKVFFQWTDQEIADEAGITREAVTQSIQRAMKSIGRRKSARVRK